MNRRVKISMLLLCVLFLGLIARVAVLSVDDAVRAAGNQQGAKTVLVAEARGTIYDRNRVPLVNATDAYYASLLPQMELAQRLEGNTDPAEYSRVLTAVREGVPTRAKLYGPTTISAGLQLYIAPQRYTERCLSPHLIGYMNGDNTAGAAGIERAYNTLLQQCSGQIATTYAMDGGGRYRIGADTRVTNTIERCRGGVVLSIDHAIQEKVENIAAASIKKGAVVVLDAESGDVLSMASYPTFHPASVAESMDDEDGALMNRCLSLFDCGSVFKIVTALAALESGVEVEQTYECPGSITVDGTTFHCHYRLGHQALNMEEAFAQSCNVYFIQLAQQIGARAVLDMAEKLGLCEEITLAESLFAPSAVLPTAADLTADAALANLSFGQGKLLVTPLHIARMTAVVADGETLPEISVVLGVVNEDGQWIEGYERGGETVISASSAAILRRMMERVVTAGTGMAAQSNEITSAGKTGTAETGQKENGRAVQHSWFTGYFPAEEPQYVVTVLVENATSADKSAAEIFCEISNNLNNLM